MNFDAVSSQFSFSIVVTLKFGRSIFKRSLIFKFEMLAILKLFKILTLTQNFVFHKQDTLFISFKMSQAKV